MKIHYATEKMRKVLEDQRLIRKYHANDFDRITNRLSELRSAKSLHDIPPVPPPRRHKLTGDLTNCWGIDYSRNDRFVIRPAGEYNIEDLTTIVEIRILRLENYH